MRKGTGGEDGSAGAEGASAGLDEGKSRLLSGIERDARAEAEEIVHAAERAAAERRKAAEVQAAVIRQEARKKADEVVRGIARQGEQAAAVESRRLALRVREEVSQRVLTEASRALATLIGRPEYRDVLKGWIVEAALGLNAAQAEVVASGPEMGQVDEDLLREAEAEVKGTSGVAVRLLRSKAQPPIGQGVVVTSSDGRTAFNNQVATRMERYQSEIRKLIYEALKES